MKNIIMTLLLLCFSVTSFSQNVWFDVIGLKSRPVKPEVLSASKQMSDFNKGYPSSWIKEADYVSSEILGTCNGKTIKVVGKNDILNKEQRSILANADVFSEISVEVKYKFNDTGIDTIDFRTMNFSVSVAPAIEAEYCEGYPKLKEYLKENAIDKISDTSIFDKQFAIVIFTIDEEGAVINAKITESSTMKKVDILLLNAINNMPKWNPAENAKGEKIKQEFEFSVGGGSC